MKKFMFAMAIIAGVFATSCNSASEKAADAAGDVKAKIENCSNPDSLKVYVDQAVEYAKKLVDEGKVQEAKDFLNDLKATVGDKAPQLSSYFDTAVATLDAIPGNVADAAEAKAEEAKDAATDAVNNAADAAKEAASGAVQDAKDKANEAVSNAQDKAADAVQNAADKVKGALGK